MATFYDPHLRRRLREREIPEDWPRDIIESTSERYRDAATGLRIAVASRFFRGKLREMAVVYAERAGGWHAITIHPISLSQKRARIVAGRWVPQ